YQGKFEDAHRELDRATSIEPHNPLVKMFRALTAYYTRRLDEATQLMREILEQNPNLHGVRPFLAMCLSAQGDHEGARGELTSEVKRNASVDPDIAYAVGSVYALEGDRDQAFEWLQRSAALGNENKPCFEHDPNLASIRSDARFGELIQRITR